MPQDQVQLRVLLRRQLCNLTICHVEVFFQGLLDHFDLDAPCFLFWHMVKYVLCPVDDQPFINNGLYVVGNAGHLSGIFGLLLRNLFKVILVLLRLLHILRDHRIADVVPLGDFSLV